MFSYDGSLRARPALTAGTSGEARQHRLRQACPSTSRLERSTVSSLACDSTGVLTSLDAPPRLAEERAVEGVAPDAH
jgi:hypothetical protein